MRRRRPVGNTAARLFALAGAVGVFVPGGATPAAAQEPEPPQPLPSERKVASMIGQVVSASTGRPLEGAVVAFIGSGYGAITDTAGNFRIPQTWAGIDTVEVRYIGYTPSRTEIELEADMATRVIFLLSQTVVRIAELTVEIEGGRRAQRLSGFEERRLKGFGVFFTPTEIRGRNPRLTSDLFRGLPGVTVGRIEHGRAMVYFGRTVADCPPAVYLDGVYQSGLQPDDIPRDDLGAVEVYRGPSETPAEYMRTGGRTCGAVVIWTPDSQEFFDMYEDPQRRKDPPR